MTTPNDPNEPRDEYPTEQFQRPMQPPIQPPTQPPTQPESAKTGILSRIGRKTLVIGGVAAAVVVVAAVGIGVWATSGSSQPVASAAATASSPQSGPSSTPKTGPDGKARRVVGTITAESGDTWTVTARSGKTMTVTLSSTTQFGTKRLPEQQSQFAVGDQIVVQGPVSDGTVTAVRVAERPAGGSGAPAPTTAGTPA